MNRPSWKLFTLCVRKRALVILPPKWILKSFFIEFLLENLKLHIIAQLVKLILLCKYSGRTFQILLWQKNVTKNSFGQASFFMELLFPLPSFHSIHPIIVSGLTDFATLESMSNINHWSRISKQKARCTRFNLKVFPGRY